MRNKTFPPLTVHTKTGQTKTFDGRYAWALRELLAAGDAGCTPIDTPGPRWSHYVWVLRRDGIEIETVTEKHGGPFPGTHARYVLCTRLTIVTADAA